MNPAENDHPSKNEVVDVPDKRHDNDAAPKSGRDKRTFPRYSAPLDIEINGHTYPALDWSLSGFRIGEVRSLGLAGEKVKAKIAVHISEFEFKFEAMAELLRLDPEKREAAFSFIGLSTEQIRALGFISAAHLSGRLKSVDGLLRNVSSGSSSGSTKTSDEEIDRVVHLEHRKVLVRRGVFALLAVVALLSARAAILTITNVSSVAAWVDVHKIDVSAPEPAIVQNIVATDGMSLKVGAPIATLSNRPLEIELANAEAEKRVLEARLDGLRTILGGRSDMLHTEEALATQAYQQAKVRREETQQSLEAVRSHAEKLTELAARGIVSLTDQAKAEQAVAEVTERAALADRAVDDAKARLASARSGFFVGDSRSTGYEPAALSLSVRELEEQIDAASVNITGLKSRLSELSMTSPCNCMVSEILLLPGERTVAQQPVMRLEPTDQARTVSAFVKHSDARRLQIGQRATVLLADGRRDRNAVITDIKTNTQLASEDKLFSRDLNPERYAQLSIRLSDEYADAPGTAVETTIHWPFLRWLANIFQV